MLAWRLCESLCERGGAGMVRDYVGNAESWPPHICFVGVMMLSDVVDWFCMRSVSRNRFRIMPNTPFRQSFPFLTLSFSAVELNLEPHLSHIICNSVPLLSTNLKPRVHV